MKKKLYFRDVDIGTGHVSRTTGFSRREHGEWLV